MAILDSLVMKTPGKCSYFMEGVSRSATFTTLTAAMIIVTGSKPHPFHDGYKVFENHTHFFLISVAYCTILYLAYGVGITQ
jgi:hypothetical protein